MPALMSGLWKKGKSGTNHGFLANRNSRNRGLSRFFYTLIDHCGDTVDMATQIGLVAEEDPVGTLMIRGGVDSSAIKITNKFESCDY
jgi:hypothetical protein